MTKTKKIIFYILSLIMFCIICFSLISFNIGKVYALIEGVSGNNFVLTGLVGNSPDHYFTNDNGESTLQNAQTKDSGGMYYSIVPTSRDSGISSGWGELELTTDMRELIKYGVVYVQANASVTSDFSNLQSNIKLTISSGEISSYIQSNNSANETSFIETELIQLLDSQSRVKLQFETLANATKNEKSSFILQTPTIRFHTIINNVYLENEDQIVSPGQIISLKAYNDITKITGISGNFLSYSKINHQINYEFLSGGEYAQIIGSNLVLADSIPDGTIIQFRAYCRESSINDDMIYSSNVVTLLVDANNIALKVKLDFENPGVIIGEGLYSKGDITSLTVQKVNPGFTFVGWYINGELSTTKLKLSRYVVNEGDEVYAKFIKTISILGVEVKAKVYDGTTNINQEDVVVNFSGLEVGHELGIFGINVSYVNVNAGENKALYIEYLDNKVELVGLDKDIYTLSSQIIPASYGDIIKREVEIVPEISYKQYGDSDPMLNFSTLNLIEGDLIQGKLGRDAGENIGEYEFNLGTLSTSNPNYKFKIAKNGAKFVITKRDLSIQTIIVEDKIYDKTTTATLKASLNNIFNNEDVNVEVFGSFVSYDVGSNIKVVIDYSNILLVGADKDNYNLLDYEGNVFGNILPRQVNVTLENCTSIYGDNINYKYSVSGLIEGDALTCNFYIDGNNVGIYDIKLQGYSNKNYSINLFSAKCEIIQREVYVYAIETNKTYGDNDPVILYEVQGLINNDILEGQLSREQGENVGEYKILIGSLYNKNYKIILTSNIFNIIKREINVEISFLDKVYDGETNVSYLINFKNNIFLEDFEVKIDATAENCWAGLQKVSYQFLEVIGNNVNNYSFNFNYLNSEITIEKRNAEIIVDDLSKIYGEEDPEFTYQITNLINGDIISVDLKRVSGEDVGQYLYELNSIPNDPNYNVSIKSGKFFVIYPKTIVVTPIYNEKVFGDDDPNFQIIVEDQSQFCFDDNFDKIIDGYLTREEGEMVGIYYYNTNKLSSSSNYNFQIKDNIAFIINKRSVEVICDNVTKVYGEEDPVFTYTVKNDIEGNELSVNIKREYGEDVGEYKLLLSTLSDPRYNITFVSGLLTIQPSEITIMAEKKIKIYGEEDPIFTVIIVDGFLKNNDILSLISSGEMIREVGEDVGVYTISQGTFNLGENYTIKFEPNILQVVQQEIYIEAAYTTKIYGEEDPIITFDIVKGQLKNGDKFTGQLSREVGENIGLYVITLGDLKINDNYKIILSNNNFEILKRQIEIIPTTLSKTYGQQEPEINYDIIGELINGDILNGSLKREIVDPIIDENVGIYKIISTLSNENYEIIFESYYFEITPAPITIKANSYEIYYGDEDPKLTYEIINGQLYNGDKISGSIYRIPGTSVGTYSIRSSLSLGKNYSLTFINGSLTINPLKIIIQCGEYEKVYGQLDPVFNYEIVFGNLLENDELSGEISREANENVGKYKLINNLYNPNYDIEMLDSYLTIKPKEVYFVSSVYDKVYDGTNVATLRNPYVTGIIDDDVVFLYDKTTCAYFETINPGNDIKVYLQNIQLFGDKASNYCLILPEYLLASITYAELSFNGIKISTEDQPVLNDGLNINFDLNKSLNEDYKIKSHKSLCSYNIWLEGEEKITTLNTAITITIEIPKEIYDLNNIYVYSVDDNGEYNLLSSYKDENGNLIVSTNNLGEFIITTDNEDWIDYGAYIGLGILVLTLLGLYVLAGYKKRGKKKKDN